ncbi:TIM-barrel domain-containing protein [Arcticibacter tournemirensis]
MNSISFHKARLKTVLLGALISLLYLQPLQAQNASSLQADKKAIVEADNARFTVLTPRLIRMEWNSSKSFDDHASFVVVNRKLPVPAYTSKRENGWLTIKTGELEMSYKLNSGSFNQENLKIKMLKSDTISWSPGKKQKYNLKGTYRTLDNYDGDTHLHNGKKIELEDGILSRDGWYFLDDSSDLRLDNSDWPWVYTRENAGTDWYFMGYGSDYKSALYDFSQISGKVPLMPRYALGYWWSRYWSYSDNELRELTANLKRFNIPADVLVIDMDWHRQGWTGWSWNKSLFPDPAKFLSWTNENHLKTTLNLHPADGVAGYEDDYNQFAQNMKFDTTGRKTIPFLASDKQFMSNLFDVILRPIEQKGIDFWWLDWQQWPNDKRITNLSNTWWLNYVFYTNMDRNRETRPMLYHRWGGLGNHRYQIGFSGDTFISWKSLEYQPYFTNTSSNVLYTYWSHDIGGHQLKHGDESVDPELYTRWLQYGALSPILRTHSTKNGKIQKEIWNFSGKYSQVQYEAIRMRYTLVPYIYTMTRKTYDTAIGLCRPMYYDYPKAEEAYRFDREYMFGDNMLIAPIGSPAVEGFSKVKVWLPEGNDWFEWHTGTLLKGGQILERAFTLNEYPIYIKAGSIIPMYGENVQNLDSNPEDITVAVFPGNNGRFTLKEDNGNDKAYKDQYASTEFSTSSNGREVTVTIGGTTGKYDGMPGKRRYILKLYGSEIPQKVLVNGKAVDFSQTLKDGNWSYTGRELSVNVSLPLSDTRKQQQVKVIYSTDNKADINNGLVGKLKRLTQLTAELKSMDNGIYLPEALGNAEETNRALEYYPQNFYQLIDKFNADYQKLPAIINDLRGVNKENQQKLLKLLQ